MSLYDFTWDTLSYGRMTAGFKRETFFIILKFLSLSPQPIISQCNLQ